MRPTILVFVLQIALAVAPPEPPAPDTCIGLDCGEIGDGVYLGLSLEQTVGLSTIYPPQEGETPDSWYEYVAVIDCSPNTIEEPRLVLCQRAVTYCEDLASDSEGPLSMLYRREVDDSGPLAPWDHFHHTCYTDHVPPRSGAEVELTEAMIIEQFHQTRFALPTTSLQPEDNRALVNLPVYFALEWPEEGFEPGEIDTTTIVGHEVRIRPAFQQATYHFGDGTSEGPTSSMGGVHPDGDITHEYTAAATVEPSITVIYGGEVSVDGSSWATIPASVQIEGPGEPLEVLTSRNRLYSD